MKKIVLLIAFVAVLISIKTFAQGGGRLPPRIYRTWMAQNGLVLGVGVCARGTRQQVKEAASVSRRCVEEMGERPYSRLIVPPAYLVTELSSGRLDLQLLSILFAPWYSRDFTQGYAIDAADEVMENMLQQLPEFARPDNTPERHQ